MAEQLQLEMGNIRISNDVVSKIAGLAALETPGIAAMSGGLSEGWAKRLSGKNVQRVLPLKWDSLKQPLICVLLFSMKLRSTRYAGCFSRMCAKQWRA